RGERAGMDDACIAVLSGKVPLVAAGAALTGNLAETASGLARLRGGSMDRQRAALLRFMTRAVEGAHLPVEQQVTSFRGLVSTFPQVTIFVRGLTVELTYTPEWHRRCHARLRCATVLIAAERFRRQHDRWPKTIEELVPDWITEVPIDPFDGQPVRFRRL